MRIIFGVLALLLMFSYECFAQAQNDSGTFIKIGLFHQEGSIKGFDYVANDLNLEVETYFAKNHLFLSGWSAGYRKEDLANFNAGHYFYSKVFRQFMFLPAEVGFKTSFGAQWGLPGSVFDDTRFYYQGGQLVAYDHLFQRTNINIPRYGTEHGDGVLLPFFEVSMTKTVKRVLFESGIRANVVSLGFDRYELSDQLMVTKTNIKKVMPSVFFNVGFRL